MVRGILSSVQDFYQTGGGQVRKPSEEQQPQRNIQPPAKLKPANAEDNYNLCRQITVCQTKNIILRKKKMETQKNWVVRWLCNGGNKDCGCGATG